MRFLLRIILFALLVFLIEYYFYRKTNRSVKSVFTRLSKSKLKKITIFLYVVLNIYPVFLIVDWSYSFLTNNHVWLPKNYLFDYLITDPFWILIFISVQCGLFYLMIDFFKLILFPVYKNYKIKWRRIEYRLILFIAVVFTIYVPIRCYYDHHVIDIRTVTYRKKEIPQSLNNFKIVLASDMQADRQTGPRRLKKFISDINTANPDLVLMGGDMITSTPDFINEAAEYVGKIKARYGVYSCVGDHDNWAYHRNYSKSLNAVTSALKKHNVFMLDDTNLVINVRHTKMKITFTTNCYVRHIPEKLLDSLTTDHSKYDFKILLTHQPRDYVIKRAVKMNYDLILAGHTHGGQVTFLFPFINLTPTLLETKFVRGNFRFGKTLLIVTRGLGMSLVPLRYNSTPEVTVINIIK